eukprot:CAMPEP_0174255294 /NCGR_PEP_ID=MMETSP0439-20130205/4642_1 /TAXON_ID=0 /ORGANISM="Stereomyxa ramosa, Strain Chinc5" /LENGTH=393 /DNA_ID=CAMNT_0015337417 /DNA_START=172 /DNA_END=1353 /DNA_ORIENTATION=-
MKGKGTDGLVKVTKGNSWPEIQEVEVDIGGTTMVWDSSEELSTSWCSTRSTSTYPILYGKRHGDPIADQTWIGVYPNCVLATVADGCSWGTRPRDAARACTIAFKEFFEENVSKITDLQHAAHLLLQCFYTCDRKIMEGKEEAWEAGTTTLIGGIAMRVKSEDSNWGFLCCSVGDCKAYHYSAKMKRVVDITGGNRKEVTNTRDPGGRLGPYLEGGLPDLRNLLLYYVSVEPGDMIFLCSDGVHDNLDPQLLGHTPQTFDLGSDKWSDLDPVVVDSIKTHYRCRFLEKLISKTGGVDPPTIDDAIVDHCWTTTESSREFMQAHPSSKLPPDHDKYPGKLDHTSCIIFTIADNYEELDMPGDQPPKKKKSKKKNSDVKSKGKGKKKADNSDISD